jgi:protocatechuate 3,4-dioxygenase beta subunit
MLPTPSDIEGPFYKVGAPFRKELTANPTLSVKGLILNTNGELIKDVLIDIWQADSGGNYDLEGFNFRAKSNDSSYEFLTVMPGAYELDEDEYRCPHIHFKIVAPGYKTLTTQLYFPDNQYNETDQWFDVRRVINYPCGEFNFVLEAL